MAAAASRYYFIFQGEELSCLQIQFLQLLSFRKSENGIISFEATGEFTQTEARRLAIKVLNTAYGLFRNSVPSVEEIQDIVEEILLDSPYKKTARAYILYRDRRSQARELVEQADIQLVDNYLDRLDWQVEENSNMAYSLQGLNNYVANEVSKNYWLNRIYSEEIRQAHNSVCSLSIVLAGICRIC